MSKLNEKVVECWFDAEWPTAIPLQNGSSWSDLDSSFYCEVRVRERQM